MKNDKAARLLARKIAGEASEEELAELDELIRAEPSLLYTLAVIDELHSTGTLPAGEEARMLERRLAALDEYPPSLPAPGPRFRMLRRWMGAAAAVAVLAVAGVYWLKPPPPATSAAREVATKAGSRSSIILSDGTKVWLNADSKLEHVDGTREVILTGEAYFDVVSNANDPFIIHAGGLDVKVLGTTLNVKAYPGEGMIETALIKGKVLVDLKEGSGKQITLEPNQKLTVTIPPPRQQQQAAASPVNPPLAYTFSAVVAEPESGIPAETSWMDGRLVFKDKPLAQILRELERWYNVKINLENTGAASETFNGTFRDKGIEHILQALQLSAGFRYRIDSTTVTIY